MRYVNNEEFSKYIKNIISEKHQIQNSEFHLTVAKILQIQSKGSIDFGGSEKIKSKISQLEPCKRKSDDKYGWWNLEKGVYIIKTNEKINISDNHIAMIVPLARTINAGGIINTKIIHNNSTKIELTLSTFNGINIKENARIAKLLILDI